MKKVQIPESELELLKVLWETSPLTLPELTVRVQQNNAWEGVTIKTLLGRLVKKGAVTQSGNKRFYQYSPALSKSEYQESASDSFLAHAFDGAAGALVNFFVQKGKLSSDELAELQKLIDGLHHD